MKNLVFVSALALLLVAMGTTDVQAQNVYQWFGGEPANSDWNYGMNWKEEFTGTFGTVPDAAAKVKINNVKWGSIAEPLIDEAVTIGDIFVAEAGAALSPEALHVGVGGTLNVVGAGGTAEGQINLGYQAGAVAGMTVDGGIVNVAGPVHVGWGGDGTLTINSGSMSVMAIDINGSATTGTGHIAVNGGQLIVYGFNVDLLQGWVDDGLLTSNGSADNVVITFDDVAGQTIVTPEPISIALLGLGALLLRKRS